MVNNCVSSWKTKELGIAVPKALGSHFIYSKCCMSLPEGEIPETGEGRRGSRRATDSLGAVACDEFQFDLCTPLSAYLHWGTPPHHVLFYYQIQNNSPQSKHLQQQSVSDYRGYFFDYFINHIKCWRNGQSFNVITNVSPLETFICE